MKIAVLSGKGGTGKTLVAVNLAVLSPGSIYLDCDVEEPNGHLFLKPQQIINEEVAIFVPEVDKDLCDGCGICVSFCKYNALAYTSKLLVFEALCHACGGCMLVCPKQALSKKRKVIGNIQTGTNHGVIAMSGFLNPGQASGTPIIHQLLSKVKPENVVFIDCPPGAACVVMDSIKDADYCILMAEPTIFGAANLKMVHELVTVFKKPHGVILNKTTAGENPSLDYCQEKSIEILGRIPFDKTIGKLNSEGKIIALEEKKYAQLLQAILRRVMQEAVV